jgi:hypothetical protein
MSLSDWPETGEDAINAAIAASGSFDRNMGEVSYGNAAHF